MGLVSEGRREAATVLELAELLLHEDHPPMVSAVASLLRETTKVDAKAVQDFLFRRSMDGNPDILRAGSENLDAARRAALIAKLEAQAASLAAGYVLGKPAAGSRASLSCSPPLGRCAPRSVVGFGSRSAEQQPAEAANASIGRRSEQKSPGQYFGPSAIFIGRSSSVVERETEDREVQERDRDAHERAARDESGREERPFALGRVVRHAFVASSASLRTRPPMKIGIVDESGR